MREERRTFPRYDTNLHLDVTPEEGGIVARMMARNLSYGGLYCISPSDFPEMTRLAVRLMVPVKQSNNGETKPLDLEAVVVRNEPMPPSTAGEKRFELGLFFTNVDETARELLARLMPAEQQVG